MDEHKKRRRGGDSKTATPKKEKKKRIPINYTYAPTKSQEEKKRNKDSLTEFHPNKNEF